jgi:hypothetical protein
MRRLVESVAAAGQLSDASATSLIERLDARLSGSEDSAFDVDMESGRTLEFTLQPMENGGWSSWLRTSPSEGSPRPRSILWPASMR